MRHKRAIAVLLITACAAVACGSASPSTESTLEQVRAMLRQRSQALMRGDVAGYLRPMSAAARAFEEPIARGSRTVPITQFDFNFDPPRDVSPDAPAYMDMTVIVVYRYNGLPYDNRFTIGLRCSFEKRNGAWMVTKSSLPPATDPGSGHQTSSTILTAMDQLPPWATGPVVVTRSTHFIVLSRPGLPNLAEAVALAEQARVRLLPRLTLEPDPVWLLSLGRNRAEAGTMGPQPFPAGVLAYAFFTFIDTGLPTDRSITVDLEYLFGSAPGLTPTVHGLDVVPVEVFQHEMGHLALARYASPSLLSWVAEGGAMYLSGERRFQAWKLGLADNFYASVSFAGLNGAESLPGPMYPYVNAAVTYLTQTYGPAKFFLFYRGFKDLADAEGHFGRPPSESDANLLLQRTYGITDSQLDGLTIAWMRRQVASGH